MGSNIAVKSNIKNYSIVFLEELIDLVENFKDENSFYLIDGSVHKLYPELLSHITEGKVLPLVANEELKTLAGAEIIFDFFLENNVNKKSNIFAIGGGVVQDVVTLATHIFHRGLEWVYVPTTLLAMSDSCIGAKSAINYKGFKNPLGVFHPPKKVLLHPAFTKTLKYQDVLSGHGEIIKLGLIGNRNINSLQSINIEGLMLNGVINSHILDTLILSSLLVKKEYVEEDEFDQGIRRILNYGHTFGHALESAMNNRIPHGQAIIIGIDIVNYVSYRLGSMSEETFEDCRCCYDKLYGDLSLDSFEINSLFDRIHKDKKTINGDVLLALMRTSGNFYLDPISIEGELRPIFTDYLTEKNIFKLNAI